MVNKTLKQQFDAFLRAPDTSASILVENQADLGQHLSFRRAVEWISARSPDDVPRAFGKLRAAQKEGLWAAGFLSYELGYVLEPKLTHLLPAERAAPLMLFGLFEEPGNLPDVDATIPGNRGRSNRGRQIAEASVDLKEFSADIERIKAYIAAGDTYQINHTFPIHVAIDEPTRALYDRIRFSAKGAYGAFLDLGPVQILSGSPELFLERVGDRLTSRPMKGTAPRGRTNDEDTWWQNWLANDPKSKAENLMILDLIRNDMGRVAVTGSVLVHDQFAIERYPTLHQMTSTVMATLRPEVTFEDIITALFPCGSITGAPKIRAMEIIRELEDHPRDVYTGAIGYVAPSGDFKFSVAIRTAVMGKDGAGTLGVGSGIVWDSDSHSEYRESLLKASFLTKSENPFQLFETMRWEAGKGFGLLDLHLDRLESSARYFQFSCGRRAVTEKLRQAEQEFSASFYRVKIVLFPTGDVEIASAPFDPIAPDTCYRLVISPKRIDSGDPFLFHKTTRREVYDAEFERVARDDGADEVLFLNERDEIVEGSRTNVFVEEDGVLITPPVTCGLLPGCLRRSLLEDDAVAIIEAPLTLNDLQAADKIYVGNALRGLIRAELSTTDQRISEMAETS